MPLESPSSRPRLVSSITDAPKKARKKPARVWVLRSGGPPMTEEERGPETTKCVWFSEDDHKEVCAGAFQNETLMRYVEPKEPKKP
jgi:uncharacterized protein YodC (DUF2158 family)